VAFYSLDMVVARKSPVAIHDERNMLRDWSLLEGTDKDLPDLSYSPCNGRRCCKPLVYAGVVDRSHGGIVEVLGQETCETRRDYKEVDRKRRDSLVRRNVYGGIERRSYHGLGGMLYKKTNARQMLRKPRRSWFPRDLGGLNMTVYAALGLRLAFSLA
jgi:hypothetical protein